MRELPVVSNWINEQDRKLVENLGLDSRQLGRKIGSGLETRVREYGEDCVVKIPYPWQRFRSASPETSIEMLQNYFPDHTPECEVVRIGKEFVILQERLQPCAFTVESDEFAEVVRNLADRNREMFDRTGMSLDLVRNAMKLHRFPYLGTKIENMMMTDKGPVMSDTSLLSVVPRYTNSTIYLMTALSDTEFVKYQARVMRSHLGLRII